MSASNMKKDQGQQTIERGKEAAATVTERIKEAGSQVGQVVSNVGSNIGHTADSATESLGSGMQSLGEKVRDKGPESGIFGKATEKVASALEEGGKYLQEEKLSGMFEDLTNMIRRNPLPALLVGVGLGFLLARTLRS